MKSLILLTILTTCLARSNMAMFGKTVKLPTVPMPIDHFNSSDDRTFEVNYYVNLTYYDKSNGAVFFNMGGEFAMNPWYSQNDESELGNYPTIESLAEEFHAAQIYLEHRYYGDSLPFDDLNTETLKYLTVEQALADHYEFLQLCKQRGYISESSPVFTMGGSYPGAMAAWFRHTYPNVTAGAYAESAVINTIIDNWQMDYQVYLSASKSGAQCPANIQKLNSMVAQALEDPSQNKQMKAIWDASFLTDVEFQWMIDDILLTVVQYSYRTGMCDAFTSMDNLMGQLQIIHDKFIGYTNGIVFYSPETLGTGAKDIQDFLPWWYQGCTQLGFFQTANPDASVSMRPQDIDLQWYKDACKTIFNETIFPDGSFTEKMGGVNIKATNIFFSNGCEDPWMVDSKIQSSGSLVAYVVEGQNQGHCAGFYDKTVEGKLSTLFSQWSSEHYEKMK